MIQATILRKAEKLQTQCAQDSEGSLRSFLQRFKIAYGQEKEGTTKVKARSASKCVHQSLGLPGPKEASKLVMALTARTALALP